MKQLVLILMGLLTFSCPSKAQKQTADTDRPSDKKILVAYFSCTGTTEKVAIAIAKETGGKLYRITPATAYTSSDLDWNDKASRSSVEMTDEKSRPALGGETIDLKDYMWCSSVIRYGGTCVRVRSIPFLRNMISRVKPLFLLPLRVAVQSRVA